MIVLVQRKAQLGLARVRLHDRVVARLRAGSLDRALAAGASPESSVPLALHAGQLCGQGERRSLARSLTRIAELARSPGSPRAQVPVSSPAVRRCERELRVLVERLSAPGPVGVRGVARLKRLVTDGTGPLYRPSPPGRLSHELLSALDALDALDGLGTVA
jgi:hypothetical protein